MVATKTRKKKQTAAPEPEPLDHIIDQLKPLAVPIADLTVDPANARTHDKKNLEAIKASLRVYKQRKPIIVNKRNGVVEAGNGTLEAAKQLGWTHLAAVYVDDDPMTQTGFAISDNRSAELAAWDDEVLGQLLGEITTTDAGLQAMFDDLAKQEKLLAAAAGESEAGGNTAPQLSHDLSHKIIITCRDEMHQADLLERLSNEGLDCKALIV